MLSQDQARDILLRHARHPSHQLPVRATHTGECKNPLCGDHVRVELAMSGEHVDGVQIQTQGCAISTATASLMSEMITERNRDELRAMISLVHSALLQKENEVWPQSIAQLEPLRHLRVTPLKVPCALIGWTALKIALAHKI